MFIALFVSLSVVFIHPWACSSTCSYLTDNPPSVVEVQQKLPCQCSTHTAVLHINRWCCQKEVLLLLTVSPTRSRLKHNQSVWICACISVCVTITWNLEHSHAVRDLLCPDQPVALPTSTPCQSHWPSPPPGLQANTLKLQNHSAHLCLHYISHTDTPVKAMGAIMVASCLVSWQPFGRSSGTQGHTVTLCQCSCPDLFRTPSHACFMFNIIGSNRSDVTLTLCAFE